MNKNKNNQFTQNIIYPFSHVTVWWSQTLDFALLHSSDIVKDPLIHHDRFYPALTHPWSYHHFHILVSSTPKAKIINPKSLHIWKSVAFLLLLRPWIIGFCFLEGIRQLPKFIRLPSGLKRKSIQLQSVFSFLLLFLGMRRHWRQNSWLKLW